MTQKEAIDILKMGHNVFLTGKAGSGKTYLLNQYIEYLKERGVGVAVTASTGIAATHIGGVTIHSWSGIGIKDKLTERDIDSMEQKPYLWKRFENTRVLVIDEVSMLHPHLLDMIDRVCKAFKRSIEPFGGMQVVLCGDFFQLPPIARGNEKINFVNKSQAWCDMNLHICYLQEQHRQTDPSFLEVLNEIRSNAVSEKTMNKLRGRYKKDPEGVKIPTRLYTHNIDVDEINARELEKINGKKYEYEMKSRGSKALVLGLKKSCLAPQNLALKKSAIVMFVKNNYEKGYVNGTTGEVIDFSYNDYPVVKISSGRKIIAEPASWMIEEEGKVKAEITQIPLRLAWAITVHKSQGMSLDAAEIDLSKSFVKGQGYVALSRVRSLSGLKLMGLNKIALQVDEEVLGFDRELIAYSKETQKSVESLNEIEKQKRYNIFIVQSGGTLDIEQIKKNRKSPSKSLGVNPSTMLRTRKSTYEKTKELLKRKLTVKEIAKERGLNEDTIIAHIEKLLDSKNLTISNIKYLQPKTKTFQSSFKKISQAFQKSGDIKLAPVRRLLKNQYSYKDLRFARLFLDLDKAED